MARKKKDENQISLFDIELPEYDAIPQQEIKQESTQVQKINFAKVPDEEFNRKFDKTNFPTVNGLLKTLDRMTYKVNRHEFLSDLFECGAIAISNRFDLRQADEREKRYLQIIKKYDKETQNVICEMFADIYTILSNQINIGFDDYLGKLYMLSETSNSYAGQFFTPYGVSKACAEITADEKIINEHIENDKILTACEPACGSGGMVLALADILYNQYNFNISRNLLIECSDIDSRCVHMTYLQLGLAGIPAIIYKRNTLTMQTWERWETPAYIMQWMRFRNVFKGTTADMEVNN